MGKLRTAFLFFCTSILVASAARAQVEFDGRTVLFGNLHAHSSLSDDVRPPSDEDWSPAAAFAYADAHGLDFLAVTDHHKAVDSSHRLSLTAAEYRQQLVDAASAYTDAHPTFVAIPGIEWGNTATGNHVNVLGAPALPPNSIRDRDYDELYAWAAERGAVIQFNHPNSWRWKSNRDVTVGNFGVALYDSQEEFVQSVDPAVSAISIICSVAGGHITGAHRRSEALTHRDAQWENHYLSYLNMGLHLSPSANQDTHWRNWGTVTAARTAVWSPAVSQQSLLSSLRNNAAYATEDADMVVYFRVEKAGHRYWMGETVPIDAEEDQVRLLIRVWQRSGPKEGPYEVTLMSDADGPGGREAAAWHTYRVLEGQFFSTEVPVVDGEYFYLRVTEEKGKDSPIGDGEDALHNDTGADGSDGIRDDLRDTAWTSPVWFARN